MSLLHLLTWLHDARALIAHWSIATGLIAIAVAAYILVPFQLARQAAIAVGVGAGIYIFAYTAGDRDGAWRIEAKYQDVIRRTEQHVAERDTAAKAEEAETVAGLNAQISDLTEKLKENDDAATQDPHAGDLGIGADSVRRLNAIGHAAPPR